MAFLYHGVICFAVGWHVLALAGIATSAEGLVLYVPLGIIIGAFVLAIFTHPRSTFAGTVAQITLRDAIRHLPLYFKVFGAVCVVYGMLTTYVMISAAKGRLGVSRGVSSTELGTVGISAFALVFGALAWLAGSSGVRAREGMRLP